MAKKQKKPHLLTFYTRYCGKLHEWLAGAKINDKEPTSFLEADSLAPVTNLIVDTQKNLRDIDKCNDRIEEYSSDPVAVTNDKMLLAFECSAAQSNSNTLVMTDFEKEVSIHNLTNQVQKLKNGNAQLSLLFLEVCKTDYENHK